MPRGLSEGQSPPSEGSFSSLRFSLSTANKSFAYFPEGAIPSWVSHAAAKIKSREVPEFSLIKPEHFRLRAESQNLCLENIAAALEQGVRAPVVIATPGFGKTYLASQIAELTGERVLHVAVTLDAMLLAQDEFSDAVQVGWYSGDRKQEGSDVTLTTYASFLNSRNGDGLDLSGYKFIILDDGHRALGRETFRFLQTLTGDQIFLAASGTPYIDAERNLSQLGPTVFELYPKEAIEAGLLAGLQSVLIKTNVRIADVPKFNGEYQAAELGKALAIDHIHKIVETITRDNYRDKNVIAFCASQDQADKLAEHLERVGIKSVSLTSDTKIQDRKDLYDGIKKGQTQVICSVRLAAQSVHLENVAAIINVAPVYAPMLAGQRIFRGSALDPKDPDKVVTVYDFLYEDPRGCPLLAPDILDGVVRIGPATAGNDFEKQHPAAQSAKSIQAELAKSGVESHVNLEEIRLELTRRQMQRVTLKPQDWVAVTNLANRWGLSPQRLRNIILKLDPNDLQLTRDENGLSLSVSPEAQKQLSMRLDPRNLLEASERGLLMTHQRMGVLAESIKTLRRLCSNHPLGRLAVCYLSESPALTKEISDLTQGEASTFVHSSIAARTRYLIEEENLSVFAVAELLTSGRKELLERLKIDLKHGAPRLESRIKVALSQYDTYLELVVKDLSPLVFLNIQRTIEQDTLPLSDDCELRHSINVVDSFENFQSDFWQNFLSALENYSPSGGCVTQFVGKIMSKTLSEDSGALEYIPTQELIEGPDSGLDSYSDLIKKSDIEFALKSLRQLPKHLRREVAQRELGMSLEALGMTEEVRGQSADIERYGEVGRQGGTTRYQKGISLLRRAFYRSEDFSGIRSYEFNLDPEFRGEGSLLGRLVADLHVHKSIRREIKRVFIAQSDQVFMGEVLGLLAKLPSSIDQLPSNISEHESKDWKTLREVFKNSLEKELFDSIDFDSKAKFGGQDIFITGFVKGVLLISEVDVSGKRSYGDDPHRIAHYFLTLRSHLEAIGVSLPKECTCDWDFYGPIEKKLSQFSWNMGASCSTELVQALSESFKTKDGQSLIDIRSFSIICGYIAGCRARHVANKYARQNEQKRKASKANEDSLPRI